MQFAPHSFSRSADGRLNIAAPSACERCRHGDGERPERFGKLERMLRNFAEGKLEATPGIEPGYTDLQSVASPLRHVALARFFSYLHRHVNRLFCRFCKTGGRVPQNLFISKRPGANSPSGAAAQCGKCRNIRRGPSNPGGVDEDGPTLLLGHARRNGRARSCAISERIVLCAAAQRLSRSVRTAKGFVNENVADRISRHGRIRGYAPPYGG